MLNLKLKTIASLVDPQDVVLDTCCDHAYLAIYLKKNHLCKDVYASDINPNALEIAKRNIQDAGESIQTYLSDGFQNIDNEKINTTVIAGVGTSTVLDIIKQAPKNIKKFLISSNNHPELLRKTLFQWGLYIQKEMAIYDKHKYYIILLVTKDLVRENRISLKYGNSKNRSYYLDLIKKEEEVIQRLPSRNFIEKWRHQKNKKELQKLIKRI